ncbi:hypothetical protein FRB91_010890 [Serendipita sp. 411]|nr:hypothetical protein FRC18_010697 [Serendipita sp. 400]KAG8848349.1 hypothetical protein FRB91_010890 [Serendipita sp. 411]
MSSPTDHVQSKEFPENYGDLRLVSSDGVVFSFHRMFLSHVSPVFKDMLEIGTGQELCLTEDSTALDQLLHLLDPAKNPRPVHINTIEGLLGAAEKYQIERVFEYWENQMTARDTTMKFIGIRHPMASFFLAGHFGRNEFASLALREVLRAPDTELDLPTLRRFTVDHKVITQLTRLRQERSRKLIDHIYNHQKTIFIPTDCCTRQALLMMGANTIPLVLQLIKEPSWNSFERNIDIWPGCPVYNSGHHKGSRVTFESWKKEILEEEMALPETAQYF